MKLKHLIKSAIAVSSIVITLSIGFIGGISNESIASTIIEPHSLLGVSAKSLDTRAKTEVNELIGAGTSDKLEGAAQQAQGIAQQKVAQLSNTAEGITNQVEGRAKSDIGQVKGAFEDVVDAGETFMEDIQDIMD